MRKLIYIPNVHTETEVGVFKALIDLAGQFNPEQAEKIQQARQNTWPKIEEGLRKLPEDLSGIKVYCETVDSQETINSWKNSLQIILDFPERERKITQMVLEDTLDESLQEFADPQIKDMRTTRILFSLMLRGASLEETEDGQYYQEMIKAAEDFENIFKDLAEGDPDEKINAVEYAEKILDAAQRFDQAQEKRDIAIAERISRSLKEGETGILVLGGGHQILDKLEGDIEVEYIDLEFKEVVEELHMKGHHLHEKLQRSFTEQLGAGDSEVKG